MTDQLNDAIVGCGGISRHHLTNIENTPAIRLDATKSAILNGLYRALNDRTYDLIYGDSVMRSAN